MKNPITPSPIKMQKSVHFINDELFPELDFNDEPLHIIRPKTSRQIRMQNENSINNLDNENSQNSIPAVKIEDYVEQNDNSETDIIKKKIINEPKPANFYHKQIDTLRQRLLELKKNFRKKPQPSQQTKIIIKNDLKSIKTPINSPTFKKIEEPKNAEINYQFKEELMKLKYFWINSI